MVAIKLFGMLSVAALGLSAFSSKRVAAFAITSRLQRGYTMFSPADRIPGRNSIERQEQPREKITVATRLEASAVLGETLVRTFANGKLDKEVVSEKVFPGTIPGFSVTKMYKTDEESGFDMDQIKEFIDADEMSRLELTPMNISVPAALMMLDPDEYPTKSRARKACRKANIMIHRGSLEVDDENGEEIVDPDKCVLVRVGDRVFPGDVICKQVRMGDGKMPRMSHEKPPFELPVVFEDDHFAIGE